MIKNKIYYWHKICGSLHNAENVPKAFKFVLDVYRDVVLVRDFTDIRKKACNYIDMNRKIQYKAFMDVAWNVALDAAFQRFVLSAKTMPYL